MRWRIYYGDPGGMVYDGDCSVHAYRAPNLNVQVLKEYSATEPRGYTITAGCNFFCWENGQAECESIERWSGKGDRYGMDDYIGYHKGAMKIITGREVYGEIFQRVMKQVAADGNFDEMNFQPGKLHRG